MQPFALHLEDTWENAFGSKHEAWNQTHERDHAQPKRTLFYPAPAARILNRGLKRSRPSYRIDSHGVSQTLRHKHERDAHAKALASLEARQQQGRKLPEAPLYHANPSNNTLDKNEWEAYQAALNEEQVLTVARQAELTADANEVLAHALTDVPQTILELLEEQVRETRAKAPKGVVAALARARLEAQEVAAEIQRHLQGMAALEKAAAC